MTMYLKAHNVWSFVDPGLQLMKSLVEGTRWHFHKFIKKVITQNLEKEQMHRLLKKHEIY